MFRIIKVVWMKRGKEIEPKNMIACSIAFDIFFVDVER